MFIRVKNIDKIQRIINRKRGKLIVVYSNNGILFSNKIYQTTTAKNILDESHRHYIVRHKSYIGTYDLVCMKFKVKLIDYERSQYSDFLRWER